MCLPPWILTESITNNCCYCYSKSNFIYVDTGGRNCSHSSPHSN